MEKYSTQQLLTAYRCMDDGIYKEMIGIELLKRKKQADVERNKRT